MLKRLPSTTMFRPPPPARWPYAVAAACAVAAALFVYRGPSLAPTDTPATAALREFLVSSCDLDAADDAPPLLAMLAAAGVDAVEDLADLDDDDVARGLDGQRSLTTVRKKKLRRKLVACVDAKVRPGRPAASFADELWDMVRGVAKKHAAKFLGTLATLAIASLRRRAGDVAADAPPAAPDDAPAAQAKAN
jgi:hypothetical protein